MKKLIALLLTLALAAMMLPCIAVADEAVDTSEHVVITYMATCLLYTSPSPRD